ncbi:cell wall hydrolase [Prevotella sp. oral taxon 313]|uniref:cell wall hydrolase n=1 Tax=Prevotella sp. oral taxon 313 TaxID=652722 RepID=UPI00351A616B
MNDYLNGKINKKTSISEINLNSNIGQLARIGYAEFRGGNSTEQLVGMDIVMNRVESDKFPNTIEGVITQPWQFSSLNKNDNNRIFYTNPSETLKIQSGKHKGELDKLNHNAWVRSLSNAIKVYKGSERGISKSALLYYSPRSMSRDKKGNPTIPKWDFNKLKEIYVAGVRASYIKMYTYKESKKKCQRK